MRDQKYVFLMLTIKQIKELPAMPIPGTQGVLVEVQEHKQVACAKGPTTVQSLKLQDGNDWIYADCWGMQDISPWRDKHVIFVSNKTGNNKMAGVSIKEKPSKDGSKTYKNLSISSACTMHSKETYEASRGSAPTPGMQPQPPVAAQPQAQAQQAAPFVPKPAVTQAPNRSVGTSAHVSIQGVTVGMAINNSVQVYLAVPEDQRHNINAEQFIWEKASAIIRVAQRLERGELYVTQPLPSYTPADTAGIESFERAIPVPRPRAQPGPGNSAFPDGPDDESVPF